MPPVSINPAFLPKKRKAAKASVQAAAMEGGEQMAAPVPSGFSGYYGTWQGLPEEARGMVQSQYSQGGFEGVSQLPGWYSLPEYTRRGILEGVMSPPKKEQVSGG